MDKFKAVEPIQQKECAPYVLFTIGRLTQKKGHYYTLHAVKKFLEKYPELQYWIAGNGPLLDSL